MRLKQCGISASWRLPDRIFSAEGNGKTVSGVMTILGKGHDVCFTVARMTINRHIVNRHMVRSHRQRVWLPSKC